VIRYYHAIPDAILKGGSDGKTVRRVIKAIITNKELGYLSTIEEDASVNEIKTAIKEAING
jgi:hypothetical protein